MAGIRIVKHCFEHCVINDLVNLLWRPSVGVVVASSFSECFQRPGNGMYVCEELHTFSAARTILTF